MAAITTTGTLTAGNSRTFALAPGSALTLTLLPNCRVTVTETPETVSASDAGGNSPRTHNHQFAGVFTYGPYVMGGSVVVDNASNSGSTVTWGRKDTTVSTSSDGLSLVSGAGKILLAPATGTVVLFGDSLMAIGNQQITPTAISRSGGVATVTAAGHGLSDQTPVRVYGVGDFGAATAVATRIDANTFAYPSPGSDGAATISAAYARVMALSWQTNNSIFVHTSGTLAGNLSQIANLGQSSETTADMLARVGEVNNYASRDVWVLAGANDVVGAVAVETTISNLRGIYAALLGLGRTVRALTIMPLGSGHAALATATPKIQQINAWIKSYCRSTLGMVLVDAHAAIVDPASATGAARTGTLQTDNIHLRPYGAQLVGAAVRGAYSGQVSTAPACLTSSQADNYGVAAANPNIWPSAPWTNTGGTISDVVSGTAADGFNVASAGNAGRVAVASVQARSDGIGYDQQVVFTPAAASDTVTIQQESTAALAARVVAGERYVLRMHVVLSGVAGSNLSYLRSRVQGTFGGVVMAIGTPMHSAATDSAAAANLDLVLESPPMVIPPGTCTSLSVETICGFSAAGTALTMRVGRVSLDRVPAL